jgi:hypothetical protein
MILFNYMLLYMEETSCFYSSFVFMINVLVAFYCGYYIYATLFFTLLLTSLIYHCQYTPITNILDKIAIFSVVFYGGYVFYKKISIDVLSFLIIMTFLSTIFMYYYGYLNNCLCFCDDPIKANLFHSFMHFVVSLGHVCICFL